MRAEMLRQLQLWNDDSGTCAWAVRASARARRLSVRVFRDGTVEVVVPARTPPERVAAFVTQHRAWIERQQRRLAPGIVPPWPPASLELAALGECWSVTALPGAGRARIRVAGVQELQLRGNLGDAAAVRAVLLDWLADRGRAAFEAPLHALADLMGVRVQRLQLRFQRTRWGSCSRRGTISLNGCLLFQRPPVLRYLMVHELAHLTHMNHSPRFWAHVARFEPELRALDSELLQGWRRVPSWVAKRVRAA